MSKTNLTIVGWTLIEDVSSEDAVSGESLKICYTKMKPSEGSRTAMRWKILSDFRS